MDKFLQNNTLVKVLAFLLAFMLWMIVSLDDQPQLTGTSQEGELTIDNVKVEAIYDEELYAIKEMDNNVQVSLTGRRALLNLNLLKADPYRVYVDLTDRGKGEHHVALQHEGFPPELQVQIIPRTVRVVLEEKEVRPFPIEIEATGRPKEGYKLGLVDIDLDEALVIAPTTVLEQVAFVKGFINVDKVDESIKRDVKLKVYDQYGNELKAEISPNVVGVDVEVISPSVKVPVKLNLSNELPQGLSLTGIETALREVEIFAPLKPLENLTELEVTIDLSQISSTKNLAYEIPLERDWTRTEPSEIGITIKVGATVQRTFNTIPIKIEGLEEGMEFQFLSPENGLLGMDIAGTRERLDQLKVDEMGATIDLSGLSVGEHVVNVTYTLPENLKALQPNIDVRINIQSADEAQAASADASEEKEGE